MSSNDGTVYALKSQDGTLLWQHALGQKLIGGLSASTKAVFVGTETGIIYALRSQDGTLLWQKTVHDTFFHLSPRIVYQTIYIGSSNGIYAYNAYDGSLIWQFSSPESHHTNNRVSTVTKGVVYTFLDGLYALQASDGALLWHDPRFRLTPAYLTIRSGKVYVPSYEHSRIYVLCANDGSPLNNFEGRHMIASDTILYISSMSKGLYAVDTKDDRIIWTNPTFTSKIAAVEGNTIYCVASVIQTPSTPGMVNPHSTKADLESLQSTRVYALDANNGSQKWSWSIPYAGGISSHPLALEGNIYFSAIGGMYALRGDDGVQLWNTLGKKLLSSDPTFG
ncbi:hypothetical protein KDA_66380 [Dictyobacter alpinus]|uniref:Pyrrolo-quinoline quinone repeat domain-containing protein n=2 Tax=Dictyobacter alpinus TaxID=2014873 RepID=A0A402BIC9_9CHLR|nr:hypothetical protein KDA_66380 [Dictyobacter alpinus]